MWVQSKIKTIKCRLNYVIGHYPPSIKMAATMDSKKVWSQSVH